MRASIIRQPGSLPLAFAVGSVVFLTAILGIATRPEHSLATFWPANAVLLGIFVRWPRSQGWASWLMACVGYLLADLATGGKLGVTSWLTLANLAGVVVGVLAYRSLGIEERTLRRPHSILVLFAISVAAASGAAIVGAGLAPETLGTDWHVGLGYWFSAEFANYLIILPTVLAFPGVGAFRRELTGQTWSFAHALPAMALLLSIGASAMIGGPGAIVFPVPALIWCALTYGFVLTTHLTMLVGIFDMLAMSFGWMEIAPAEGSLSAIISIRIGVALLTLGPLTVASIAAAYERAIGQLEYAANHDAVTGIPSRRTFAAEGTRMLTNAARRGEPMTVLMIDIDHFKRVNDGHGHDVGDRVLACTAQTIRAVLPSDVLFCRMGGEEFAACIPQRSREDALAIAERIRQALHTLPPSELPRVTISIGAAHRYPRREDLLQGMLRDADRALYAAKAAGRDCVMLHNEDDLAPRDLLMSIP